MTKLYTVGIFPLLLLGTVSCHRGGTPAMPHEPEYVSVPVVPTSRYQGDVSSSNADPEGEDRISSLQLMQVSLPSGKNHKFYKKNFIDGIGSDQLAQVKISNDYFGDTNGTGWAFMVANLPGLKDQLVTTENRRNAASFYDIEIDALKALVPPFPMSMTCQTITFMLDRENNTKIGISPDPGSNGAFRIPGVSYLDQTTDYFQLARVIAAISLKVEYNPQNQTLTDFKAEILNVPKKIRLFARKQYRPDDYYSNTPQGLTSELDKPENRSIKENLIKSPKKTKNETDGGLAKTIVDFGHI